MEQNINKLLCKEGLFIGSNLKNSIKELSEELKQGKKPSFSTISDLIANIFLRITRVGLFTFFGLLVNALLIAFEISFLWQQINILERQTNIINQQTEKLEFQNKIVENQNELITQQNLLSEANRRSSLIFLFSNVMDKLDEELKERDKNNEPRKLSSQLIGRIVSLTNGFRPYRYLTEANILSELLSPERGQILVNLMNADLDTLTYNIIFAQASFESASFENSKLMKEYLKGINLVKADLKNTSLIDSDLRHANLGGAKLNNANLMMANLSHTSMMRTNLSQSSLVGAILNSTVLVEANLSFADLREAELNGTFLIGANLQGASLSSVTINNTIFDGVNLLHAKVKSEDFFKILKDNDCKGVEELEQKYKLEKIEEDGEIYYQIVLK